MTFDFERKIRKKPSFTRHGNVQHTDKEKAPSADLPPLYECQRKTVPPVSYLSTRVEIKVFA